MFCCQTKKKDFNISLADNLGIARKLNKKLEQSNYEVSVIKNKEPKKISNTLDFIKKQNNTILEKKKIIRKS